MKKYLNKSISLIVSIFIIISATFIVAENFKHQNKIIPNKPDITEESSMVQLKGDYDSEILGSSNLQQILSNISNINSENLPEDEDYNPQRPHKENQSSVSDGLSDSGNGKSSLHKKDEDAIETQSDSGNRESDYFITSIVNNEIVTVKDYSFTITQKNPSILVENVTVTVNEINSGEFNGTVNLKAGRNIIAVMVTYKGQDGKAFTITQKYCVIYEKNKIVIYTDIKNNMKVVQSRFSFKAYAVKDGKELPINVLLNGENQKSASARQYVVNLKEGTNEIQIEAMGNSDKKTQKYTIYCNEKESDITFDTDLYNHEVDEPEYSFTASARYNDSKIKCTVTKDNVELDDNSKGEYSVTLNEGKNIFILMASSSGVTKKETYTITYVKKVSGGGDDAPDENDKFSPVIYTDIKDGETISGKIKNIEVHAKDYKGNYIESSGIGVYCNGKSAQLIWANLEQISYRLSLKEGENSIRIQASDKEGNEAARNYTLNCKPAADGEILGEATISIEATTIGMGYIIPPTKVQIEEGKNGACILDELLHKNGFDYECTGTLNSGFYLSRILFNKDIVKPNVPEDLARHCQEEADYFDTEDCYSDSLGEFDICNGSGWMYSINGVYPNYGFSDLYLKPGDVIRIRYTLYYGKDIGGASAMGDGGGNWEKEW